MAREGNGSHEPYGTLPGSETGGGGRRQDAELRRMAMFRIREAANRLATLANSAQDERLRDELLRIYRALLDHERALLDGSSPPARKRSKGEDA